MTLLDLVKKSPWAGPIMLGQVEILNQLIAKSNLPLRPIKRVEGETTEAFVARLATIDVSIPIKDSEYAFGVLGVQAIRFINVHTANPIADGETITEFDPVTTGPDFEIPPGAVENLHAMGIDLPAGLEATAKYEVFNGVMAFAVYKLLEDQLNPKLSKTARQESLLRACRRIEKLVGKTMWYSVVRRIYEALHTDSGYKNPTFIPDDNNIPLSRVQYRQKHVWADSVNRTERNISL